VTDPAAHSPLVPGYTGFTVLARGGYATVYRAIQESLGREVAVKVENRIMESERDQRRFLREARAAGRMSSHPHVVDLFDAGVSHDGHPYLIMELCHGSYAERMRSQPLTAVEARDVGVKIADALAAAHRVGVLHRDVKPANILVQDFGGPALADFGLAVIVEARDHSVTLDVLTPAYAPPEMFRNAPPSPAADVYSLCATLYALMCGRPPRWGETNPSLIALVELFDKPVPALPGVPPDLIELLRAGMVADETQRPSAVQLRDALIGLALRAGVAPIVVPTLSPVPYQPSLADSEHPTEPRGSAPAAWPAGPGGGPPWTPDGQVSGGPVSGGPVSGGPVSGGPASGGPVSGGPASGGPVSGGPVSGGPVSGGLGWGASPAPDPWSRAAGSWPGAPLPPAADPWSGAAGTTGPGTGGPPGGVGPGSGWPPPAPQPGVPGARRRRTLVAALAGGVVAALALGAIAWGALRSGAQPTPAPSGIAGASTPAAPPTAAPSTSAQGCAPSGMLPGARCVTKPECYGELVVSGGSARAPVVPCDSPHTWEVFALGDLPTEVAVADHQTVRTHPQVSSVCSATTLALVSLSLQAWQIQVLPPSPEALSAGDRTYRCLAGKGPNALSTPQFKPGG
jgi:tRNA A-37 threonylcarbamoyl transferase component Bud32